MSTSARNLILANLATLLAALFFAWDIGWLFWPYWIQSVVIGWYARKRMLSLARFSTRGFTSGGKPVPETEAGKRSTATFFAFHYGFFHLGYLAFLFAEHRIADALDALVLIACGFSFVLSQRATYAVQHAADLRGCPNLGKMMATPYLRIVPMHLGVLFFAGAGSSPMALVLFTALKTASDLGLDLIDRRYAERAAAKTAHVP
ncbi:MAG: DUF6498-containing protein [Pseudomonadota bacterium]